MERCVRYAITAHEIRNALKDAHAGATEEEMNGLLTGSFLEVWQGLPREYAFKKTISAGKLPALRVESPNVYIWVMPDACAALEKNPGHMLFALGNRCPNSIEFFCVVSAPEEIAGFEAISYARERNRAGVPALLQYLRGQKHQRQKQINKPQINRRRTKRGGSK